MSLRHWTAVFLVAAAAALGAEPASAKTLTVTTVGNGTVTGGSVRQPNTINCGPNSAGDCTEDYGVSLGMPQVVGLTATAQPEWVFTGWSGACTGSSSSCALLMDADYSVSASFMRVRGRIAFSSNRDGNGDVYAMNADGSGQTRLTNDPASDFEPAWSPDGTRIAFTSRRDGDYEIYVMNADGSGQTRLTNNPRDDHQPAWSPDGTRIAFRSHQGDYPEVYAMNADGSGQTRLTRDYGSSGWPAWSPDGTRITFASYRDSSFEIYIMNADGSGRTRLTNDGAFDIEPAWSPDGQRIAFRRGVSGAQIYVMEADGSRQTNVTNSPNYSSDPTWSPDGQRIAFQRGSAIYVMRADGSEQTNVTNDAGNDGAPAWGPLRPRLSVTKAGNGSGVVAGAGIDCGSDCSEAFVFGASALLTAVPTARSVFAGWSGPCTGIGSCAVTMDQTRSVKAAFRSVSDRIVFVSNGQISAMSADGSGQANLTMNPAGWDSAPAVSPDGQLIAFQSRDEIDFVDDDIYVMNADGSGKRQLTSDAGYDSLPTWSPDGQRIAFESGRDGNEEIYVMNADGSGQIRLTNNVAIDGGPAWSPDGQRIAFASDRDGGLDIYVVSADGTGLTRLTSAPAADVEPAWSPDGQRIAFRSQRNGNPEIWLMNADGSGQAPLTGTRFAHEGQPSWSPDGTGIAFATDRDGQSEIYVMNADGSGQTRLTTNLGFDADPYWALELRAGGGGGGGGGSGSGGADVIAPVFRFVSRVRVGKRVVHTLSEPATTRFTVERRRLGRPRWVRLRGSFSRAGVQGQNSFKFTGRLRGKRLPPGRYRLVAIARDAAGNASAPARATFRVVRRP